ncbi:hypothetical protein EDB19DRAFT_1783424 [Suillus lakei]|nr:hypothetical protein EDB19DRAFT_1783424 [Suillus lakei]
MWPFLDSRLCVSLWGLCHPVPHHRYLWVIAVSSESDLIRSLSRSRAAFAFRCAVRIEFPVYPKALLLSTFRQSFIVIFEAALTSSYFVGHLSASTSALSAVKFCSSSSPSNSTTLSSPSDQSESESGA